MRRMFLTLSALLLLAGQAWAEAPKAYSIFYSADWCTACKVLEPKLTAVRPAFEGQPIEFIRIDLTNQATAEASIEQVKALGIDGVVKSNAKATGFILVLDGATKQPVDRIFASQSEAQIKAKLQQAIDS